MAAGAAELHLMADCLNGLMAVTADNLGYPQAAEELIRAGWAYATARTRSLVSSAVEDPAHIGATLACRCGNSSAPSHASLPVRLPGPR